MSEVDGPLLSEVTEQAIALLIDRFYAAVRQERVLGPVFEAAISAEEWPEHLATMRRFWSSVMLASGRYSGNPVSVHRAVPTFSGLCSPTGSLCSRRRRGSCSSRM